MNIIQRQILAQARRQAVSTLLDRCIIEKQSIQGGVFGHQPGLWTVVGTDIPCRLIQAGEQSVSQVSVNSSIEVISERYTLLLPVTQDINIDYRVTVNSQVFEVTQLETELTNSFFKSVIVTRFRGDNG